MDGGLGGDASGCDDADDADDGGGGGDEEGGAGLQVGGITTRDGGRFVGFLYVWREEVGKMTGGGHGRSERTCLDMIIFAIESGSSDWYNAGTEGQRSNKIRMGFGRSMYERGVSKAGPPLLTL